MSCWLKSAAPAFPHHLISTHKLKSGKVVECGATCAVLSVVCTAQRSVGKASFLFRSPSLGYWNWQQYSGMSAASSSASRVCRDPLWSQVTTVTPVVPSVCEFSHRLPAAVLWYTVCCKCVLGPQKEQKHCEIYLDWLKSRTELFPMSQRTLKHKQQNSLRAHKEKHKPNYVGWGGALIKGPHSKLPRGKQRKSSHWLYVSPHHAKFKAISGACLILRVHECMWACAKEKRQQSEQRRRIAMISFYVMR